MVPLSTLLRIVDVLNGRRKLHAFCTMFYATATFELSTLAGLMFLMGALIIFHTISLGVLSDESGMVAELFHGLLSAIQLCFNKFQIVAQCLETHGKVLAFGGPIRNRKIHRKCGDDVNTHLNF